MNVTPLFGDVQAEVFVCTCYSEGIVIWRNDEFYFLSLWGAQNNTSLRWRIKMAWQALKGQSCSEVVLTPSQAHTLARAIQDADSPQPSNSIAQTSPTNPSNNL